ncbi:MAG: LLM class flavin-dependent oxidoreductase, partial [Gammaproteobacteria bacterium]|nr:LLM class flavin-dependent oxidoreductase [Gammaproteobacteria bacterium]
HETRYRLGQEWYDIVKKCWSETDGDFDWDGEFYQLKGVHSYPKPVNGIIPVFNAGGSKEGKAFATRNANYLFTPVIEHEKSRTDIRDLKQQAGALGREVGVFALTYVVCRPTQKEADDFHDWYARDNADWTAVDRVIELMFANAESFPKDVIKMLRERMAGGHGGMPLVGTPDNVVAELEKLHEIGCAGATLSFVDFAGEFPYFRDEVLPRLEEKGLRG